MLTPSSCHSCVWLQASPLIFTNVAACTEELALSLSRAPHTHYIYLYVAITFGPVHNGCPSTEEILWLQFLPSNSNSSTTYCGKTRMILLIKFNQSSNLEFLFCSKYARPVKEIKRTISSHFKNKTIQKYSLERGFLISASLRRTYYNN